MEHLSCPWGLGPVIAGRCCHPRRREVQMLRPPGGCLLGGSSVPSPRIGRFFSLDRHVFHPARAFHLGPSETLGRKQESGCV
jgi:hypothetical protein